MKVIAKGHLKPIAIPGYECRMLTDKVLILFEKPFKPIEAVVKQVGKNLVEVYADKIEVINAITKALELDIVDVEAT